MAKSKSVLAWAVYNTRTRKLVMIKGRVWGLSHTELGAKAQACGRSEIAVQVRITPIL